MSEDNNAANDPNDNAALSYDDWENYDPDDDAYYDADLPPIVADLRPGETIEKRNARILEGNRQQREADRPEGTKSDPGLSFVNGRREIHPQKITLPVPPRIPAEGLSAALRDRSRTLGSPLTD